MDKKYPPDDDEFDPDDVDEEQDDKRLECQPLDITLTKL